MHRLCLLILGLGLCTAAWSRPGQDTPPAEPDRSAADRSPVDLVLTADEKWILTANQTANTVSLVNADSGKVHAEIPCGRHPAAVTITPDGRHILVSGTYSGNVTLFELQDDQLRHVATIPVGFEPRGIAVAPDSRTAYVAMTAAHAVGVLDLQKRALVERIPAGHWPRYLALTPDGKRLAVGVNGDGGVAVIDTEARKKLYSEEFAGINFGQMQVARDGKHVYVPWMVYRHNPITAGNIRLGWVLASRIARVRLDGPARREAISVDPQGMAVADPHGLALTPDEQWLVCAASGTQELLVYRRPDLPFRDFGGTDHIEPALLKDKERFSRIPLGGRPMAIRCSADGKRVYVANYLLNAIQVVDLPARKAARAAAGRPQGADAGPSRRGDILRRPSLARPVVQLSQLPLRGAYQCGDDGHQKRRPLRQLQGRAEPPQRHAHGALLLARLGEGPRQGAAPLDDRHDARQDATGRRRAGADRVP